MRKFDVTELDRALRRLRYRLRQRRWMNALAIAALTGAGARLIGLGALECLLCVVFTFVATLLVQSLVGKRR
ncbi:MAG: hypothetical protein ACK2U9_20845, partial [Anaerolineae bacterium]